MWIHRAFSLLNQREFRLINTFISLNRRETCGGERQPACHGAARAARRACAVRGCRSLIGNQLRHIDKNKPDRFNLLVHWPLFWAIYLPCTCRLTTLSQLHRNQHHAPSLRYAQGFYIFRRCALCLLANLRTPVTVQILCTQAAARVSS